MNTPTTETNPWINCSPQNTIQLGYWTAAWLLTMAIAAFGPKFIWNEISWISLAAILVNLAIGFGMIMANKRHLQGQDEMMQKIQLEAMAWALGVGLVCGLSYQLLDTTNLIAGDAQISNLILLMGLTYGGAVILGLRRYR